MGKGREKRKRREKKLKRQEETQVKSLDLKKKATPVQPKKPDPMEAILREANSAK